MAVIPPRNYEDEEILLFLSTLMEPNPMRVPEIAAKILAGVSGENKGNIVAAIMIFLADLSSDLPDSFVVLMLEAIAFMREDKQKFHESMRRISNN